MINEDIGRVGFFGHWLIILDKFQLKGMGVDDESICG